MRLILSLAFLILVTATATADPPKAKPAGCVCTDGCKCTGTCPGCCPTQITYAEAFAAVSKGERVTVFYRVSPPPGGVAGKWVYSDSIPASGPGKYEAFRQGNLNVLRLVTPPIFYQVGSDPNCSGGR